MKNQTKPPKYDKPTDTNKPKGLNESHVKDCDCKACMIACETCPIKPSFRDKMVKK